MSCGLANMPSNHGGNHALPLHITIVSICMFLYVYFPHQKAAALGKDVAPSSRQNSSQ